VSTPPRLALSPDEAAKRLGIARSTFYKSVLPEIRVVNLGRRRLVPVRELDRWLERHARHPLDAARR
jgi:excisionase family DNA binding protein